MTFAIDWQIMLGTADNYLRPHMTFVAHPGCGSPSPRCTTRRSKRSSPQTRSFWVWAGPQVTSQGMRRTWVFQLAFQEANHSGGIHGRQVTVISYPGAVTTADKVANAKS